MQAKQNLARWIFNHKWVFLVWEFVMLQRMEHSIFSPTTPWLLNEFHISPVGGYQGALETYEWLAWKVRKISLISKFVLFVINLLIQKFCSCLSLGLNLELSTKAFRWILSFGLFFISFFIVYFHCWVMLFCFFFKIYQIDQGSRLDNRNI